MAPAITVLGSGSAGNTTLLEADGFSLLIDVGLGVRQIATRLATVGVSWPRIRAVLLTHTHGDHWNDRVFAHLLRLRIPVWCHPDHLAVLRRHCSCFKAMGRAKLIRTYEGDRPWSFTGLLQCRPLSVRHDSGSTFGFRFDGAASLFGRAWSLGYATDLGSWDESLVEGLAEVDLLAVEFNHDVGLQMASGRPAHLIERVLSDEGHLSNEQAAALAAAVVRRSAPRRLARLVQLHLSRQCNRPELARRAARRALEQFAPGTEVHTAEQDAPLPRLWMRESDEAMYAA
ncbi:MAG TPA: MBL fold metallo-hydrolase [Pirellulales bacterium]|nr:MBL fold metallo-hydrolase [Pirellulales bacterium]